MYNFRFHELHGYDSQYFNKLVKYCREKFNCSLEDINSLAVKLIAGEKDKIRAHVIYAECLGDMAGFAIFYYFPQTKVGFLEALVIFENYRELGIGSHLYYRVVDFLKEHYSECSGHLLEMCQDRENYCKRKAFFLKQGCIPLDLGFFLSDDNISKTGIQLLYHPYLLNQEYSLQRMEEILRDMSHQIIN